jgi:hypothetical protein
MPAALCDGIIDVFEVMFPVKLPPGMLIRVKTAIYLITDVLHQNCKKNLVMDMGKAHFVLESDETANSEEKKSYRLLRSSCEPPSDDVFHGTSNW